MIDPVGRRSMRTFQEYEQAMNELQAIARSNVEDADFTMWESEIRTAVAFHEIPGDAIEYMEGE